MSTSNVTRHKVDEELTRELFDEAVEDLDKFLASAKQLAKNLDLFIGQALMLIGTGSVVAPDSPEIRRAVRLAAQAHAAMFAAAGSTPEKPVAVPLGDDDVTYTAPPHESTLHPGRWITGFYLALLCGDADCMETLCRIDPDTLRRSSSKGPEYDYLYMRSLIAWRAAPDEMGGLVVAALKATIPDSNVVYDADWALYLVGHQLEVLMSVVTHDPNVTSVFTKALERHAAYWSKTPDRRRDFSGYISIPLTALALQAKQRGLSIEVTSPYLATQLADG